MRSADMVVLLLVARRRRCAPCSRRRTASRVPSPMARARGQGAAPPRIRMKAARNTLRAKLRVSAATTTPRRPRRRAPRAPRGAARAGPRSRPRSERCGQGTAPATFPLAKSVRAGQLREQKHDFFRDAGSETGAQCVQRGHQHQSRSMPQYARRAATRDARSTAGRVEDRRDTRAPQPPVQLDPLERTPHQPARKPCEQRLPRAGSRPPQSPAAGRVALAAKGAPARPV